MALKNRGNFLAKQGLSSSILFIGNMMISTLVALLASIILSLNHKIFVALFPVAVVFMVSFVLVGLTLSVYRTISDTLLYCAYIDRDICFQTSTDFWNNDERNNDVQLTLLRFYRGQINNS